MEENYIEYLEVGSGGRGIIVENSGDNNNELYNNEFNGLFSAIQAQKDNRNGNEGLKLFCNDLYYSYYNISVFPLGIAKAQQISNKGDDENKYLPAGNEFSYCELHPSVYNQTNFYNYDADFVNYLSEPGWEPICVTNYDPLHNVNVSTAPFPSEQEKCPSKIVRKELSVDDLLAEYSYAEIVCNSSLVILNIWKDGGNADLSEEVETIEPWDVYVEFNDLIAQSPYLSDEVLLATIANDAFSSEMIKLLMVANPQAAHSSEIMQALEERIPPMPQSYMDEIIEGGESVSQLEVLEANAAADRHWLSTIGNEIKHRYRVDETDISASIDNLIAFVDGKGSVESRYELAYRTV